MSMNKKIVFFLELMKGASDYFEWERINEALKPFGLRVVYATGEIETIPSPDDKVPPKKPKDK